MDRGFALAVKKCFISLKVRKAFIFSENLSIQPWILNPKNLVNYCPGSISELYSICIKLSTQYQPIYQLSKVSLLLTYEEKSCAQSLKGELSAF